MRDYNKIVLSNDETNEALGVAGREVRIGVPGYGAPVESGVLAARTVAPGYEGFGKNRAKGRVVVPGYGTAPLTVQISRSQNS
ncbi:MAG: hypothetical protein M3P37_13355 [Actinomycetota bacterium]|nr:hypothetical protein [Actinomycetota bacterium]